MSWQKDYRHFIFLTNLSYLLKHLHVNVDFLEQILENLV